MPPSRRVECCSAGAASSAHVVRVIAGSPRAGYFPACTRDPPHRSGLRPIDRIPHCLWDT
eukprot:12871348-Heterocapsa_arctica.AAC.1